MRTDLLDRAVGQEVRQVLTDPERLAAEYARRLREPAHAEHEQARPGVAQQERKVRQGMGRLIDSYAEGLSEQADCEPRLLRLKERVAALEAQARAGRRRRRASSIAARYWSSTSLCGNG